MPGIDDTIIITPHQALELGWSIIPITNRKIPMITSWKPYQTRLPTPQEIDAWLTKRPAGWAIVTGSVSGRFTLDFDGDQGHNTIQLLNLVPHRITPSGGYHVDFAYPGWRITTLAGKVKIELGQRWPGMDIRGDGGYVGFAGQMTKGKYAWLRIPEAYDVNILPAELVEFLKTGPDQLAPEPVPHANGSLPDGTRLIRMALDMVPGQGRNASGFWLASQLRDNRYSSDDAWLILREYGSLCPKTNSKGQPEEYRESEMTATLKQVYGHAPREAWTTPVKTPEPKAPPVEKKPNGEDPPTPHKHFVTAKNAIWYVDDETGSETFICSQLDVVAYARDINSESWGRLLRWKDAARKEHSWVAPMRMLVGQGMQFRETLADGGLEVSTNPKTDHLLTQYVRSQKPLRFMFSVPHVGWFDHTFVFPEATIPSDADVGYQTMGKGEHFYRSKGTLESWQENISRKCIGNSRPVFALSVAFAGPLMRPLNIQGGGFHFFSGSSMGKSTTQWVAGSVWGGGGRNGFARTWAATKNALESVAELHNDGCLILDEMRMIDPREVEQIVYMLANGAGKSRENRTMTGRRTLEWLCMLLSSGEIQLSDCAALAGQRIKAGAEIRMATIPADAGKGMGIFEKLNGAIDSRVFAETLENAAKENYGTAIAPFIEFILEYYEKIVIDGRQYIESLMAEILEDMPEASSEVRRVLRRFLAAGYAGEVATAAGITGWPEGEATKAAVTCFRAWLMNKGGWEPTDVINAIQQIRDIIATKGRFRPADPEKNDEGQIINQERIPDALGYWKRLEAGELLYLIDPGAFKRELCEGFDARSILKELRARHLLYVSENNRFTKKLEVTLPTGDLVRLRFVAIRQQILNEDWTGENEDFTGASGASGASLTK